MNRLSNRSLVKAFVSVPLIIFLIAAGLRSMVAIWLPDEAAWPDGRRYERVAFNLLHGKGFGEIGKNRNSVPTQPVLIAGVYSIFGEKNYLALRLFFVLIGAITCVVGYGLAKHLFGETAAIISGLLLAVYPYFIYLSALFEYPQGFFIFVMALFFLALFRFSEHGGKLTLFGSGLCLGIGILSVPTALIFVPFVLLYLLSRPFTESVKRLLIVLIATAIPVGTWSLRNYVAYDHFVLVNASGGKNFWLANNETYYRYGKEGVVPVCSEQYQDTVYCAQKRALKKHLDESNLTGIQKISEDEAMSWKHGLEFVRNSPAKFAELGVKKFLAFWSPIPNAVHDETAHGGQARNLVSVLSYTPILILAAWGVILSRHQWRRLIPVYGYFIAFTAAYAVFLPTTRYRLPLDFFLILFAGVAVAHWLKSKKWANRALYSGILRDQPNDINK